MKIGVDDFSRKTLGIKRKILSTLKRSVALSTLATARITYSSGLRKIGSTLLAAAGQMGTVDVKHLIGLELETGACFPVDPYVARQWFKEAADGGHVPSMLQFARLCLLQHPSFGVKGALAKKTHLGAPPFVAEPELARDYALRSADTGNVEGLNLAGYLLATGQGGPVDIATALRLYGAAVAAGHPEACLGLGTLFMTGKAGKIDYPSARGCFRIAASSGNSAARYSLGLMLLNGLGGTVEEAAAIGLFASAARKGHVASMRQLAKWHLEAGRSEKQHRAGVAWLKKLGNLGELSAVLDLIQRYRRGNGVGQSATEAAIWLRKAAELGDTQSQFELALAHMSGDFEGANLADAIELYRSAAESGHPLAQWHLDRLQDTPAYRRPAARSPMDEFASVMGMNVAAAE